MGISAYRMAKETGLSPTRLGQIIRGERGVTAETAFKIGRYLNTGPEFWLNLQAFYDIEEASRKYVKELKNIRPCGVVEAGRGVLSSVSGRPRFPSHFRRCYNILWQRNH